MYYIFIGLEPMASKLLKKCFQKVGLWHPQHDEQNRCFDCKNGKFSSQEISEGSGSKSNWRIRVLSHFILLHTCDRIQRVQSFGEKQPKTLAFHTDYYIEQNSTLTVKKVQRYSRPQLEYHLPNSTWPRIMYRIPVPGTFGQKIFRKLVIYLQCRVSACKKN